LSNGGGGAATGTISTLIAAGWMMMDPRSTADAADRGAHYEHGAAGVGAV
jgi:hypothetical protein